MLLHTPRLFLRAIQLEDAPFMYDLLRSEGWLRFIGDRNIKTIEDSKAYIQGIIQKEGFDYFVIVERESNRAIGVLSYIFRVQKNVPDFGFALLPNYQKKGYAFEAGRAFLDWKKVQESWVSMIAFTKQDNVASIGLLEKLGFVREGIIQRDGEDLLRFGWAI